MGREMILEYCGSNSCRESIQTLSNQIGGQIQRIQLLEAFSMNAKEIISTQKDRIGKLQAENIRLTEQLAAAGLNPHQ